MSVCYHGRLARSCDQCEHIAFLGQLEIEETCRMLANIGTGVLIAHLAEIAEDLNMQSDCRHPYAWRIVSTYSPYYADEAKP